LRLEGIGAGMGHGTRVVVPQLVVQVLEALDDSWTDLGFASLGDVSPPPGVRAHLFDAHHCARVRRRHGDHTPEAVRSRRCGLFRNVSRAVIVGPSRRPSYRLLRRRRRLKLAVRVDRRTPRGGCQPAARLATVAEPATTCRSPQRVALRRLPYGDTSHTARVACKPLGRPWDRREAVGGRGRGCVEGTRSWLHAIGAALGLTAGLRTSYKEAPEGNVGFGQLRSEGPGSMGMDLVAVNASARQNVRWS